MLYLVEHHETICFTSGKVLAKIHPSHRRQSSVLTNSSDMITELAPIKPENVDFRAYAFDAKQGLSSDDTDNENSHTSSEGASDTNAIGDAMKTSEIAPRASF